MILINIGSNRSSIHGDRFYNLNKSISLILFEQIKIIKISSIYETPSYPNKQYPSFLNVSLLINSKLTASNLLKKFKKIEKKMERYKGPKNKPRTCDIDLIDYNGKVINTKDIILPHPRAHKRNFVLYPLKEIDPDWVHPIFNEKIDVLINKLNLKLRNEITRLRESVIIK